MSKQTLFKINHWANELGVSSKTIRRAILRGHLEAVQTGVGRNSPYRMNQSMIDDWLAGRVVRGRRLW